MVDGKISQGNSTTSKPVWDGNKPVDVVFEIRRSGITTKAGDQVVLAWTGDSQQLSLYPTWKVPNPASVFIGTGNNHGTMEISRIELGPIDAPAKSVAKAGPRTPAAVPKPAAGRAGTVGRSSVHVRRGQAISGALGCGHWHAGDGNQFDRHEARAHPRWRIHDGLTSRPKSTP